ncbi:hypothetical protein SLA2020_187770 [Shorea laevis]
MARRICRSLISLSLNNTAFLHKPPISNSLCVLFFSSSTPEKSKSSFPMLDYLINHQFSPEVALKASLSIPYLKNPENSDSILSFLKENGFTKSHIEEILKRKPNLLCSSVDNTIKPKLEIFRDLGFSPDEIADFMAADPWLLQRSLDSRLAPSISVLKTVLGSSDAVCKALKISGWFLKLDLEKTMMPNIELLRSCGVSSSQIINFVYSFPRFFLIKPEGMRELIKRVDELGVSRVSKMYLYAVRTLSSMSPETWENKLKLFSSFGLSEDQILSVFRRSPHVFAVSETKIKEFGEMLLARENIDASYIFEHPELLIYSVKSRLEPRLAVYEILERKNLLRKKTQLTSLFRMSPQKFLDNYVLPFSNELGDLPKVLKTRTR